MQTQLVGEDLHGRWKWRGCAVGIDGCLYSMPQHATHILKINPADDSTSFVGPDGMGSSKWGRCITGPDGLIYGIPRMSTHVLKFNPISQEVTMVGEKLEGENGAYLSAAAVRPSGTIYFLSSSNGKMVCYDPIINKFTTFIGDHLQKDGWHGAVWAGDGSKKKGGDVLYAVPYNANRVLRFDPNVEPTNFFERLLIMLKQSITFIDDSSGPRHSSWSKWSSAVVGPDGNVYGIPWDHDKILKIDVATQSTSLVGPDLGRGRYKYSGGVVGYDNHIYMIPYSAEFVLKFNPLTGTTSTVGESLGSEGGKYRGGALAPNGYIYSAPYNAKQVLKVKTFDNWIYLRARLLVEQGRSTQKAIQSNDDDLQIVQHFIMHTNDDIFRNILEMCKI